MDDDRHDIEQLLDWLKSRELLQRVKKIRYLSKINVTMEDGQVKDSEETWSTTEIEVEFK